MNKAIIQTAISILMSILLSTICYSHITLYSYEEKIDKADVIMVGQVNIVNKTLQGYKYALVTPKRFIKGKSIYKNISIKYGNSYNMAQEDTTNYEVGKTYVMFLKQYKNNYHPMGGGGHHYLVDDDGKIKNEDWIKVPIDKYIENIERIISIKK